MTLIIIALIAFVGICIALWKGLKYKGDLDMQINFLKGQISIKKKK